MIQTTGLGAHRPLCGQLYKYTNVMKGWQQRWFAVDPETGVLSYYLFDGPGDTIQPGQPARGEAHLAAAVICPSDEDSRTFTINCASGDMLKLRATDARARQEWVNSLRAIAEIHTKVMGSNPPLQPREQLAVHDAMASARHQLQQTELRQRQQPVCNVFFNVSASFTVNNSIQRSVWAKAQTVKIVNELIVLIDFSPVLNS